MLAVLPRMYMDCNELHPISTMLHNKVWVHCFHQLIGAGIGVPVQYMQAHDTSVVDNTC